MDYNLSSLTFESSSSTASLPNDETLNNDVTPYTCTKDFYRKRKKQMGFIREHWNTTTDFTLCCVMYVISVENIWRFPLNVLNRGGIVYLIFYIIISIIFVYPLIIMQMNLGQFCGRSITRCWGYCPAVSGIGACSILLMFVALTLTADLNSWSMFYLTKAIFGGKTWLYCGIDVVSDKDCYNVTDFLSQGLSEYTLSSITYFWLRNFGEDVSEEMIANRTLNNSLMLVYYIFFITLGIFLNIYYKASSTHSLPLTFFSFYFILFHFLVLGMCDNDFGKYIALCLKPDVRRLKTLKFFISVFAETVVSYGLGYGGIIVLSSLNRFKDNYLWSARFTILFKILSNIFVVFAIFPYIGYYIERNIPVKGHAKLTFQVILEQVSIFPRPRLWAFLLFAMTGCMNVTNITMMFKVMVLSIRDIFGPRVNVKNVTLVFTFFWIEFTACAAMYMKYRVFVNQTVYQHIATPGMMLILQIQITSYCYIYGLNNVKRDMTMLLNRSISFLWAIPLFIFSVAFLMITMFTLYSLGFSGYVGLTISVIIVIFIYKEIRLIFKMKTRNTDMGWFKCVMSTFSESNIWGPRVARLWIYHPFTIKLKMHEKEVVDAELDEKKPLAF